MIPAMAARAPILPPPDLPPLSGANVTLVEYSLGILNATTSPTRAAIPHALKTNLRLAHTFLGQFYQIYFLFLRLWRGYVLYFFFAHNSNYLKRLTIVAIIAAIEAVVLPIPRISVVVIFLFCSLLGTIISQPGSMAFLFPALKRETVPFMYIT